MRARLGARLGARTFSSRNGGQMDLEQLIANYPRVYHMAERDTWPSIRQNGLRSTTSVLDWLGVSADLRLQLRSEHRRDKVPVQGQGRTIVLRDQRPMPPRILAESLLNGVTPRQWYETINDKVFFWAAERRLMGLLGAKLYRELEHDVLTLDTRSFAAAHQAKIWLCHMNSGAVVPWKLRRDMTIFKRIADYPVKRNGSPTKPVVEIVVDGEVLDVADHLVEVRRMKGAEVLGTLYARGTGRDGGAPPPAVEAIASGAPRPPGDRSSG